jgi:acyl-CoA oxidase
LYIEGKNEGIHTFLVRIRKEDKSLADGVFIEDMGHKLGLNGVDNARIAFNNVRIPRINILNKYSDIDENGVFKSSIAKRRDRFLNVADRLLSGRLCIAAMIDSCARVTLATAFKYGSKRLAVGTSGKSDTPISEFNLF